MSLYKEYYDKNITWQPTTIKGLKGLPTFSDNRDELDNLIDPLFRVHKQISGNGQFSIENGDTLTRLITSRANAELFVEIGTASVFKKSSTQTFISNKRDETKFISIDIASRAGETLDKPNIQYVVSDSTSPEVTKYFDEKLIDILFIDGDHSIKTVFKEYEFYLPLMKKDGIIVLHDVTMHPGPFLLMEAIDDQIFRKEKLHEEDMGMGIIYLQ